MSSSVLLWIAGGWLLLRVLPIFMAFLVLLRVTLQHTVYRAVEEAEIDPELAAFLRAVSAPLVAMGFEELSFLRIRRALRSAHDQVDVLALVHPASGTVASIGPGSPGVAPNRAIPSRTETPQPAASTSSGDARQPFGCDGTCTSRRTFDPPNPGCMSVMAGSNGGTRAISPFGTIARRCIWRRGTSSNPISTASFTALRWSVRSWSASMAARPDRSRDCRSCRPPRSCGPWRRSSKEAVT